MPRDAYLRLAVAEGCGPALVPALLDPAVAPETLLRAPPPLPPRAGRRLTDPGLAAHAMRWCEAARAHKLALWTPADREYPERLRHAPLRPLTLFARGSAAAAVAGGVAVVGSRTPTPYGLAACEDFATALARAGVVLWSGLALGIDARAHRCALACGTPTVAVLAGGLDSIYPAIHRDLARRITAASGLLLAEAPPGQRAQRGHFPRRNRIMAAAADAVLVIEAGQASGAMSTAHWAAEAGVPVFAVPGPYTSPRSTGCHALIADGAQVARDPEDLLRRLGVELALRGAPAAGLDGDADQAAILAVLAGGPRPADLVQREARLSERPFRRALLELVSQGAVQPLPGDLLAARAFSGQREVSR